MIGSSFVQGGWGGERAFDPSWLSFAPPWMGIILTTPVDHTPKILLNDKEEEFSRVIHLNDSAV